MRGWPANRESEPHVSENDHKPPQPPPLSPAALSQGPLAAPAAAPIPTPLENAIPFAAKQPNPNLPPPPLTWRHKAWVYTDTFLRTAYVSIAKPAFWGAAASAASLLLLMLLFGRDEIGTALANLSPSRLASPNTSRLLALAAAIGAFCVAVWSAKDYSFDGKGFLVRSLAEHIPKARAKLGRTPLVYLQFYHGVLRYAGALSFLCEIVFQIVAFAIVTWGVATAWPALELFRPGAAISLSNTTLFWAAHVFGLIDGPEVFGLAAPLEANTSMWALGIAVIAFKLGVIGLCITLFRSSLALEPRDISEAWGRILERKE